MESRQLLTATALANGVGTDIEYSGPYGTYMPVGSPAYNGYSSFGNIDIPANSFGLNSGVSAVNSLSLNLYNSSAVGVGNQNYLPTGGEFAVYFVPNDTVTVSNMRFGGPGSLAGSPFTGLAALGTTTGGASSLNVDSTDLVGTFTVTSALPAGYSTFPFSSLGAGAASGIAADLNNGTNVRLAVVPMDNTGKVDWEGDYSGSSPQVELDVNEAPLVNFDSSTYSVSETDQVSGDHTIATIAVQRSGNPSGSLDINYATSNGTAQQPADYTAASGTLHWNAGDTTDKTFTVSFNNITTTDPSRTVNLTLTDHGGNPIAPIFPAGGNTATLSINYLQAGKLSIDQSSYSVDEAAGTVAVKVDRSGTNVATSTADVTLTTANGLPYQISPQDPQDAQAGRNFGTLGNSSAPSFPVHFAAGQTQATVNIPIIDLKTFADTRSFTASLANPSTGTQIVTAASQTTITINDDAVANGVTLAGLATQTDGIETNGPYSGDANSFLPLVSAPTGGFNFATMPVLTFGTGSAVFPTGTTSTVDSVKLSIYNTATTGSFAGVPGSFDVYLLTDNTVPDSELEYLGGVGNTGPSVIGSQASPVYIGTASFPNNQVGYNDFVFDNLPASVKSALTADLNSGGTSGIRFAITPSQGSPVAADWEGNYFYNQPQLTLLTEPGTAAAPPTVNNVLVDGTSWTPSFLNALQTAGEGNGQGYAIPVGSASQLKDLPWSNINQIQVVFSQNVTVQQASLALTGVNVASYGISNFSYNSATDTATWTLANPIAADKLHIDLASSGGAAVTGASSGEVHRRRLDKRLECISLGQRHCRRRFQFLVQRPAGRWQPGRHRERAGSGCCRFALATNERPDRRYER